MIIKENKSNILFKWLKLDNAAKIYPSITNSFETNFFRLSATLYDFVDVDILQKALKIIFPRFPYFQVYIKRGLFWFYFEKTEDIIPLTCEKSLPCQKVDLFNNNFLIKIIPYGKRIAVESTHILTDGYGLLNFLKSLLLIYLKLKYNENGDFGDIITPSKEIEEEEYIDAYQKFYKIKTNLPPKKKKAYHIKDKLIGKNKFEIIRAILPLDLTYKKAKEYGVSVNDFLVANTLYAYQKYYLENVKSRKKDIITIAVPVNLRSHYKINTMRNFSYIIDPSIDLNLGVYSFEEILYQVHHFIRLNNTPKNLLPYLKRNISSEKNIIVKLIPLIFKDFILKISYNAIGSKPISTSLSNLGIVKVPEWMEKYIESFDFIPSPSPTLKYLIGVIGFKDKIILNFNKTCKTNKIAQYFFSNLNNIGIQAKINVSWR